MRALYIRNNDHFTSIPIAEPFYQKICHAYPYNMSLGFIMDFRHFVESDLPKEEWAEYLQVFDENGNIHLEDAPLHDSLTCLYYIFNHLDIDFKTTKIMPRDVAFLFAHSYKVLTQFYKEEYDDEFKCFFLDIDNWNIIGYLESIK